MHNKLSTFRRIVIKIGSSLLVDKSTGLKEVWLNSLLDDVATLKSSGSEILIVSSGAIALGRSILGLPAGVLKLEENQAAAAAGQISLAGIFSNLLQKHGIHTGQILLTYGDTEERRRYLNARATVETLLKLGAIPIINENDTVATSEIRYGDNDRLAARVATMMSADLLILLSDIDGLYTAPPAENSDASHIETVGDITPEIDNMAGDAGTQLSRGGMVTKISAAKICTENGAAMIITSGKQSNPLNALDHGARHTFFIPKETPRNARKKWIAGQLQTKGALIIDEGARLALKNGKSLLPAGVKNTAGRFFRGDMVSIVSQTAEGLAGNSLGQGIVAFDFDTANSIIGKRSGEIEDILGYAGRTEMIHRDDMILNEQMNADKSDV